MDKTVKMVKNEVLNNLELIDIPEEILRKAKKSRENFHLVSRQLCLSENDKTFRGFKLAVEDYLD